MLNFSHHLFATSHLVAEGSNTGTGGNLLMILLMATAVIVLFVLPTRRQKKLQNELKQRQDQLGPGTAVMTNFGLFGTVKSVDRDEQFALLEIAPGTVAKVHLSTVTTILDEERNDLTEDPAGSLRASSADNATTSGADPQAEDFNK